MDALSDSPSAGAARLLPSEWVALVVALFWSVLLVVVVSAVPVYEETTVTDLGGSIHSSATLIDENGSRALIVVGVPLLVTILVGVALWIRGRRRGAGPVAWTFTILLAGFNVLAMLSIGLLIIPITACLALACAIHHAGRPGDVETAGRRWHRS